MIIYEAKVPEFLKTVNDPRVLAVEISKNLLDKFGISVASNEVRSWTFSLPKVAKLIKEDKRDNRRVLVEFNIPTTKQRIDFIILGKDEKGFPSAWLLELKQWSDVSEVEWNGFRVGKYIDTHPSGQASDYKFRLEHEMGLENKIHINAAAYLHNLKDQESPLYNETYKKMLEGAILYSALSEEELSNKIDKHTLIREGDESFNLFKEANWAPSKKFKEIVRNEFNDTNLVGTQKEIYEKIERFVKSKDKDEKLTFLISGDPGSGKTIVAFKLLMLLVSELNMKIQLMIPGQEVRDAFKYELRKRMLSQWISGSNIWNGYDAAIIDEAHKAIGRDTGLVNYKRMYETLKFGIIFIDDDQIINRKGISKEQVKMIAKEKGHQVYEYEIEENFRNCGERSLLDWIDYIFYNRKTKNRGFEYSLKLYKNSSNTYKLFGYANDDDFIDDYYKVHSNKKNVRMVSLWHQEFYNGPADENGNVPKTVPIGKHYFVWNPNTEWFSKLAMEDKKTYNTELKKFAKQRRNFLTGKPKADYIAYFNHIQGYEFEHIFVYIPNIFTLENGKLIFHRDRLAKEVKISQTWSPNSKSKELGDQDPLLLNKTFFLNRIKVMLTRGTKSTHVYAEDKALNKLILDSIED